MSPDSGIAHMVAPHLAPRWNPWQGLPVRLTSWHLAGPAQAPSMLALSTITLQEPGVFRPPRSLNSRTLWTTEGKMLSPREAPGHRGNH